MVESIQSGERSTDSSTVHHCTQWLAPDKAAFSISAPGCQVWQSSAHSRLIATTTYMCTRPLLGLLLLHDQPTNQYISHCVESTARNSEFVHHECDYTRKLISATLSQYRHRDNTLTIYNIRVVHSAEIAECRQ